MKISVLNGLELREKLVVGNVRKRILMTRMLVKIMIEIMVVIFTITVISVN